MRSVAPVAGITGRSRESPTAHVAPSGYLLSMSFVVAVYGLIAMALWWIFGQLPVYTCLALPPKCDNLPPVGQWDWLQYSALTYVGLFAVAMLVTRALERRSS